LLNVFLLLFIPHRGTAAGMTGHLILNPPFCFCGAIKKGTATLCSSKARQGPQGTRERHPFCQKANEHQMLHVSLPKKLAGLRRNAKSSVQNDIYLSKTVFFATKELIYKAYNISFFELCAFLS